MLTVGVALCVLLIVLAVGVELVGRRLELGRFERLTNLGLGGLRALFELRTRGIQAFLFGATRALFAKLFGVAPLDAWSPATWLLCFVGYDLLFYWAHRASHRPGWLWAIHAVHHQSTRFEVTVGLRASLLNSAALLPFFLPLAAFGVPTEVYAGVAITHFLAMAWLHTDAIKPARWVDLVLNTPPLHHVHHSRDARQRDKNFGGVLILWDRLFGTYAARERVLATGVDGRARAPGIIAAQLLPALELWSRARRR